MMYEDQLERVRRFLKRLEDSSRTSNQIEYEDMVWAFAQNCWHLTDWIQNDDAADPTLKANAFNEAQKASYIRVCRDLAIRSKHLKFTWSKPWVDANLRADITVVSGGRRNPTEGRFIYYAVDENNTRYEFPEAAQKALTEWEEIINRYAAKTP